MGALVCDFILSWREKKVLLVQYGLGGLRMQNKQPYGIELALLASVILAGSSIPRAIRSQKPLPSALSVLALYGLYTYISAYRKRL